MTEQSPGAPPTEESPRTAGRPPKMTERFRVSYFAERGDHAAAIERAKTDGVDWSEAMRQLEARYAAGKLKVTVR